MRKKLIEIIIKVSGFLLRGMFKDTYIVKVDGGIASQMFQYAMGYSLKRSKSCKVLYDLSWYEKCGVDIDGKFFRNFDLLKLFPNLPFEKARNIYGYIYVNLYRYLVDGSKYRYFDVTEVPKAPLFLDGYRYKIPNDLLKEVYDNCFVLQPPENVLDEVNQGIYHQIKKCDKSIAVHVRRGDMAQERHGYRPLTPDYFIKCMNYEEVKDGTFFFFSDEIEWVKEQIIPLIGGKQYIVVDVNGSDKGYMDLYLCASCDHIISSQGTMGRTAAMMSKKQDSMLLFVPDYKDSPIFKEVKFVKKVIAVKDEVE